MKIHKATTTCGLAAFATAALLTGQAFAAPINYSETFDLVLNDVQADADGATFASYADWTFYDKNNDNAGEAFADTFNDEMSLVVASGQSELIAGLISANAIAGTSTFDVSTNDLNVSLDLGARFGTVSGSRSVSLVVGDIHFGFLPGHSSGGTDGFHFIGNLTTGGQEHLGFQDMGFVPLAGKAGTTEDTAFNTIDVAISDAGTDYLFTYSITDGTNTYNNAISIAKTTVGDLDQLGIRTQTFGQSTTSSFDNFTVTQVPEPGSLALIALGGLCVLRRRRA